MDFQTFLNESFNQGEAARHLKSASDHPEQSAEHKKHMANHHAQMFWHHHHAGEHAQAKQHMDKMKHFEA